MPKGLVGIHVLRSTNIQGLQRVNVVATDDKYEQNEVVQGEMWRLRVAW